jgi:hypothetical protein
MQYGANAASGYSLMSCNYYSETQMSGYDLTGHCSYLYSYCYMIVQYDGTFGGLTWFIHEIFLPFLKKTDPSYFLINISSQCDGT